MDELVFEIMRFVVVVAVILIVRYAVPFFKQLAETSKMDGIVQWVEQAVLYAQQVHWDAPGEEKKAIVVKFLKELLEKKNISITDEQLDILIEAAVKAMKMQEGIETVEVENYEGDLGDDCTLDEGESAQARE